ncbi:MULTISPECIES: hypothetical protein [unclassified Nocardia]|nr:MULTISPECIES: hypothetical protein [unclassified Nocardia]
MTEPTAPTTFETITDRELKLIAKTPADHKDRAIVVYGRVAETLRDPDLGAELARLVCGATPDQATWETEIMIGTTEDQLRDVVEGDEVRVEVTSTGRRATYTSVLGVEMSNPSFWVSGISLLDS